MFEPVSALRVWLSRRGGAGRGGICIGDIGAAGFGG